MNGSPVRVASTVGYPDGSSNTGAKLYEGRDLAMTTDFRLVLGEVISRYLGNNDLRSVFPGFQNEQGKFLKLLG